MDTQGEEVSETLLLNGECVETMRGFGDATVDAVVCDPPYHLTSIVERFGKPDAAPSKVPEGGSGVYARSSRGFMGQTWDGGDIAFRAETWREVWRVLKPGGYLLAFSGTRTYHRMAVAIEDAGFEIRDCLSWQYGSGFPKSLDIPYTIGLPYGLCRSSASVPHVVLSFAPTRLPSNAGTAPIALARAVILPVGVPVLAIQIGEGAGSSEATDTSWFVWESGTTWSIALSWQECWDALSSPERLFTTVTRTVETTMRATLKCLQEASTRHTTIPAHARSAGCVSAACVAEVSSTDDLRSIALTPTPIAPDVAIEVTRSMREQAGRGLALKPAWEPIVVARKPLEGTVAGNVLKHGTGALNIDGCRVAAPEGDDFTKAWDRPVSTNIGASGGAYITTGEQHTVDLSANKPTGGRWPANVLLSCPPDCDGDTHAPGCPCAALDAQHNGASRYFNRLPIEEEDLVPFVYAAKAARSEREEGCDALPARTGAEAVEREEGSAGTKSPRAGAGRTADSVRNNHPTVKPVSVMRHLVRLVTPPGGLVLDPFMGSGTTGIAAVREGFDFVGIEMNPEYLAIAEARIEHAKAKG